MSNQFLPIAVAVVLIAPSAIRAQDGHTSHVHVPPAEGVDPAKLVRERIQKARLTTDFTDLLKALPVKGGVQDEQLQRIAEIIRANPQLLEMVNGLRAGDDEKAKQLARELIATSGQGGRMPSVQSLAALQQQLTKIRPLDINSLPPGTQVLPPITSRPKPDPAEQSARRQIATQIAEMAERFPREHLPESVRNSPEVQNLFRRLSESAADALRTPAGGDGLDAQLARLEGHWETIRNWMPKEMPAVLRQIHIPDLSRFAPSVQMPHVELAPPSMPSAPHFGGGRVDLGGAVNVILVVLGVVVVAGILWHFRGGRISNAGSGGRVLGPWPLDPARVASREELIRAFEYLSLLRCGEPARTWHHRAIAERLGGTEAERRAAAERLATLYEHARYTPVTGGEPDWSAAREPLTLLAGAG
jgi:hypothetical protein